ncbi:uncharacterized protein LOC125674864 [Ostrea edulis]|uniref:uncharacterized protein LOC125674864 n=1 Tax=Ostrea edulis TaxID=37623 RepID=UPI0020941B1C|nr:uncharacterized protein LOC125674864 [Ostrea edulis]
MHYYWSKDENAMEFYEYGKNELSLPKEDTNQHIHQKRTFMFVKDGEIDREKNNRLGNKAVKDTRMTHCFRPVAPYVITSRERSCFCDVCRCINGTCEEKCSNELLTGNWVVQNISNKRRNRPDGAKRTVTEAENEDVGSEDGDITDGQNEVNTNEDEKGDNGMVNVNRDDITDNLGNTESLQNIQHEDNIVGQMVYDLESSVNIRGLSDIIADRLNPDTEPVDFSDLSGMLEFDEKMDVFVAEGLGQTSPQRESIIHSDQQTEYRSRKFVGVNTFSNLCSGKETDFIGPLWMTSLGSHMIAYIDFCQYLFYPSSLPLEENYLNFETFTLAHTIQNSYCCCIEINVFLSAEKIVSVLLP